MKIAMLSPIAWSTPPRNGAARESMVSLLTEGLVSRGFDVTLFATVDSRTQGTLQAVFPAGYAEQPACNPQVWDCLHISELFERAGEFDLVHNNLDHIPLTYTGLVQTPVVTTIHGFSAPSVLPVYKKYNGKVFYVSVSDADRSAELDYIATIHYGIDPGLFDFSPVPDDYLLFGGGFCRDQGADEAVGIARACKRRLLMAGVVTDHDYFKDRIEPFIDGSQIRFVGNPGPEKRRELLGRAAAVLHPLNCSEPFSLTAIEAMACGTPVIAPRCGWLPELIEDGRNGFLVSDVRAAAAAVERLPQIDRRRCRARVEERFTAERMVEQYISIYRQVIEQTQREDHRPWGFYQVLADQNTFKSKRIVVYPGKRLSLQRHRRRDEHWYMLEGDALVTLDERTIALTHGQSIDIPRGSLHRITNHGSGNVVFIEVQTGDYFGEDDIERLEDDFGRT